MMYLITLPLVSYSPSLVNTISRLILDWFINFYTFFEIECTRRSSRLFYWNVSCMKRERDVCTLLSFVFWETYITLISIPLFKFPSSSKSLHYSLKNECFYFIFIFIRRTVNARNWKRNTKIKCAKMRIRHVNVKAINIVVIQMMVPWKDIDAININISIINIIKENDRMILIAANLIVIISAIRNRTQKPRRLTNCWTMIRIGLRYLHIQVCMNTFSCFCSNSRKIG